MVTLSFYYYLFVLLYTTCILLFNCLYIICYCLSRYLFLVLNKCKPIGPTVLLCQCSFPCSCTHLRHNLPLPMVPNHPGQNFTMSSDGHKLLVAQCQKIFQLCHHLSLIGPPGAEIVLPGAFHKLKGDLLELFSPAYPTEDVAFRLLRSTRGFFGDVLATFRGHYFRSIISLANSIGQQRMNPWKLREALQRAEINFKSKNRKVNKTGIDLFHRVMSFASRHDSHGLRNFLNGLVGKSLHITPTHTLKPHHTHTHSTNTTRDFHIPKHTNKPPHKQPLLPTPTLTHNRFSLLNNTTSTNTNTHTHKSSLFDPSKPKINVQGAQHKLSNFYPCRMSYKQQYFRSAEHAYQHTKATFVNNHQAAAAILQAPHAYLAKSIGNSVNKKCTHTQKKSWDHHKLDIMRDIIKHKYSQSELFREHLLGTKGAEITHNLVDSFWGSSFFCSKRGQLQQSNWFSTILMEERAKHCTPPTRSTSAPRVPRATIPRTKDTSRPSKDTSTTRAPPVTVPATQEAQQTVGATSTPTSKTLNATMAPTAPPTPPPTTQQPGGATSTTPDRTTPSKDARGHPTPSTSNPKQGAPATTSEQAQEAHPTPTHNADTSTKDTTPPKAPSAPTPGSQDTPQPQRTKTSPRHRRVPLLQTPAPQTQQGTSAPPTTPPEAEQPSQGTSKLATPTRNPPPEDTTTPQNQRPLCSTPVTLKPSKAANPPAPQYIAPTKRTRRALDLSPVSTLPPSTTGPDTSSDISSLGHLQDPLPPAEATQTTFDPEISGSSLGLGQSAVSPPITQRSFNRHSPLSTVRNIAAHTSDSTTTKIQGPNIKYYTSDKKKTPWIMPQVHAPVLILGDSNLNRITRTPFNTDIQLLSFSGAKLTHFASGHLFTYPQPQVTHVVFSCGINNKDMQQKTIDEQLRKIAARLKRFFPQAKVHIPLLNWSPMKEAKFTDTYQMINQGILKLDKLGITILPPLPADEFHTSFEDGVQDIHHWSATTANRLLASWVNSLN